MTILLSLTETHPKFVRTCAAIRSVLQKTGRVAEVPALLDRLAIRNTYAHCGLARHWYLQGDRNAMERAARKCLDADPEFLPAWTEWLHGLASQQRLAEALPAIELLEKGSWIRRAVIAAYAIYGKPEAIIVEAEQAQRIRKGDPDLERILFAGYLQSGRWDDALRLAQEGAAAARLRGDLDLERQLTGRMGAVANRQGRYADGENYLQKAVAMARELSDADSERVYRHELAETLRHSGKLEEATAEIDPVIKMLRAGRATIDLGRAIHTRSEIHLESGNYTGALASLRKARAAARAIGGDTGGELEAAASTTEIRLALGDVGGALEEIKGALRIARLQQRSELVRILPVAARVYVAAGNRSEAAKLYAEAREAATKQKDIRTGFDVALREAELDGRPAAFDAARQLANAIGSKIITARLDLSEAAALDKSGNTATALQRFESALAAGLAIPSPEIIWRARAGIAWVKTRLQARAEAIEQYRLATEAIENVRANLLSLEDRANFFAARTKLYKDAANLLLQERKPAEAFAFADRGRARSLLDSLSTNPETKTVVPAGSIVLLYFLHPDGAKVFALTEGTPLVVALPASEARIEAAVREYRALISSPPVRVTQARMTDLSHQLYADLLKPVEPLLKGKREIIVIPDGSLFYLPFEALRNPASGQYAGHRFDFVYAPSWNVYAALRAKPKSATTSALLAYGDADYREPWKRLPFSREEVQSIAGLYSAKARVGSEASETALRADAAGGSHRMIHLAVHAKADEASPRFSSLVFASDDRNDGLLHAYEIQRMLLPAELVVLSGCETAMGKRLTGEGITGLTQNFLQAGAASVAASLWKVEDRATAEFMRLFHLELRRGRAPAAALRLARTQLAARFEHPFYWAAFILIGGSR